MRKQSTCRQRPPATASMAAISAPPGPGRSPPPLIHVGCSRSASSTAVTPPSLMPMPTPPGYVDRPSMSSRVRPASATAATQASTVSDSGSIINRRPICERPMPESTERRSNRSAPVGGRGLGTLGAGTSSAASAFTSPVGSNSGTQTSSCCSNRTDTSWPICTSAGSQPTMFVVRCTPGSSAKATLAMAYGGSNPGSHCWAFTVTPTTVARPETGVACHDRLRQFGQMGTGGCTNVEQSLQRWMRRRPSAPDFQNHSLAGVSSGRGRTLHS